MPTKAAKYANGKLQHVYPLDGRIHVTNGRNCWCKPTPDKIQPLVLIHRHYDEWKKENEQPQEGNPKVAHV